ncbi:lysophospholipid acyltransferase family protein [Candidatus Stoquefichus massiliensis]|uniref:lysophospholipid acyltransferase family protein n=1 Tax=Candidatus Stoquefichus massiliensis TaxID=1470350 RepID=UPI0004819CFD|nr:lysophospholipid acyltransferase family protein [Candidatus Stoquefichus massiliensis]
MKRILFLIIRLLYRIPGWLLKIRYYNKHLDETSFEERFDFGQKMIRKINSKSRVHIHCYGVENLPEEQGYLLAPNHQGLFDALILFGTHDKPFKAIVKEELMSVFVLGKVLKMLQFEAMDRQNLRASMKIIKKATKEMSSGRNYVIFPEGTRCRKQNQMLEFKGGTFKSVVDAKKPIVPVALIDCYKVFDNNTIAPVDAQIHYLEPIYYDDYKDMNSTEIAHHVQERIAQCIKENEDKFSKV